VAGGDFSSEGAVGAADTPGMNRLHDSTGRQQLRLEAALAARLDNLYRAWPMLTGFAVRRDLMLDEVAWYPALAEKQAEALCSAIAIELAELMDERPEVADLLRGRTFVRALN
jgi:hypothetical protein